MEKKQRVSGTWRTGIPKRISNAVKREGDLPETTSSAGADTPVAWRVAGDERGSWWTYWETKPNWLKQTIIQPLYATPPAPATEVLTGAALGRWCYENPNLAATTIEGLRHGSRAPADRAKIIEQCARIAECWDDREICEDIAKAIRDELAIPPQEGK